MSKFFPIDYITYRKDGKIPDYVKISMVKTKSKGFTILPLTPDEFNDKAYHCGFRHIKEITIPKIQSIREHINGFFIAEGDLDIYENFDFNKFIKNNYQEPIWIGYKKKLSNYIVGNFLIYFPIESLDTLQDYLNKQKRLVYSDRFFTKLYDYGFLKLKDKSIASEIVHYSNVINAIRF